MMLRLVAIFVVCSANIYWNVDGADGVAAVPNSELQEENRPLSLTYLGNVGTKQFFVDDEIVTWHDAFGVCANAGLNLVKIKSEAEWFFIREQLMVHDHGPFWLGGRDVGNRWMFRWSQYPSTPNAEDPDTMLGTFIYYYNFVEQGPLALQMNAAVGTAVFGAHSFGKTAKAFCQTG